jgi:putative PIN family toxin of toxin-antitoxin system
MRALLDTNLFISYLLSSGRTGSAVGVILEAAFRGAFTLLFAIEIAEEMIATTAARPDLMARIGSGDVAEMFRQVENVAEVLPRLPAPPPEVGRDRKDDFLIAHAVLAHADYLVSRDRDLLDLVDIAGVRFVSPPAFLEVLRAADRLPR